MNSQILQNKSDIKSHNYKGKFCFIGISIGPDNSSESGIAVLDRNLNLIKTDKAYNLSELKLLISNISPPANTILCVDLPKNIMMLTGKWRIESKQTQILSMKNMPDTLKGSWQKRYSDRGSELCVYFDSLGMEIYRYSPYYTKNLLKLNPPYKSRTPAACKFLQNIIEEKLEISNMPVNLLPLPSLNAIIGAFIGWKVSTCDENTGYKQIGVYKDFPIISSTLLCPVSYKY